MNLAKMKTTKAYMETFKASNIPESQAIKYLNTEEREDYEYLKFKEAQDKRYAKKVENARNVAAKSGNDKDNDDFDFK